MKRLSLLYIAAIALLVASCSGNKQSFTLYGDFKGLETGEFLCFSQSPAWNSLDTVKVKGGDLIVNYKDDGQVTLTGNASLIFEGIIEY